MRKSKQIVYELILEKEEVTVNELKNRTRLSRQSIHKNLNELLSENKIFKRGSPPFVYYSEFDSVIGGSSNPSKNNKVYDIAIIGAGPVGTLFARELSKYFSVALIEKNKYGFCRKTFSIVNENARKNRIEDCLQGTLMAEVGLYSFLNKRSSIKKLDLEESKWGVVLDNAKYFKKLRNEIEENGSDIFEYNEVIRMFTRKEFVKLVTDKADFHAKLVIDCSGVNSKFLTQNNRKYEYYFSVYGRVSKKVIDKSEPFLTYLLAHVATVDNEKIFVNNVPESGRFLPWVYTISSDMKSLDEMRNYFDVANKEDYLRSQNLEYGSKEYYGWIPVGDLYVSSENRIIAFGDAGSMAPANSGMTFDFTLKRIDTYVDRIRELFLKNDFSVYSLEGVKRLSLIHI